MVALQDPALTLNGFDAMMTEPHPVEGWEAYAFSSADGTDFGNPEAVITAIASQLADGDLENIDRYGNREATFFVGFTAPGVDDPGRAIAMGQEALELALRFKGWAPLAWTDVLAGAETSVMEMTAATVSKDFDDEAELFDGMRVVVVTVHARPFVRPVDEVTIEAPPVAPTTPPADVVVTDGSSVTNWSLAKVHAGDTLSLASTSGKVTGAVIHPAPESGSRTAPLTWGAVITFDATRPIIEIKVTGSYGIFGSGGGAIGSGSCAVSVSGLVGATVSSVTPDAILLTQTADIPAGWTLTATTPAGLAAPPTGGRTSVAVAVDSIKQKAPAATGAFQSRQVPIYGSQRTELSLAIRGLNAAGTTPAALGEQVLVHTASAGADGRAKFIGCRDTSGLSSSAETAAVSGGYNLLDAVTGTPTVFAFPASTLLPGEYVAYARLKATAAGAHTISIAAALDGAGTLDASDPATGWYTAQVAALTTYRIFPLKSLMLPPANIEDDSATLSIKVAADVASVVKLDEIWLAHVASGQVTLIDTNDPGISAVRLDAATVDSPQPSAWAGVATSTGTGVMMSAGARILAFDQHMAEPGLLQISTVTPGCTTSRASARYYPKNAHDVAPRGWVPPAVEVG